MKCWLKPSETWLRNRWVRLALSSVQWWLAGCEQQTVILIITCKCGTVMCMTTSFCLNVCVCPAHTMMFIVCLHKCVNELKIWIIKIEQVHQLSGLAYIPTCRSSGQFVSHGSRLFVSPGSMAVLYIIDFSLSIIGGLTPGPMFTKIGGDCSRRLSAILQNFRPIVQMVYEMCVTKIFHLLALGLTPGPKFTKRGDDLLPT